jgi:hypothetical protein
MFEIVRGLGDGFGFAVIEGRRLTEYGKNLQKQHRQQNR